MHGAELRCVGLTNDCMHTSFLFSNIKLWLNNDPFLKNCLVLLFLWSFKIIFISMVHVFNN